MNPFSRSRFLFLFILLLTISPVHAILDTNQNGASDLWERHHNNGNLYSNFIPTADPDGDGWTNAQEAAAGTHPADANPPTGFLRPEITRYPAVHGTPEVEGDPPVLISPEAISIEWTPLAGKKYSLFASSDLSLGSWIPIGEPQIGNRYFTPSFYIPLTQPDGSIPPKLFFRLSAEDTDTDSDTLTDYEENQLGSSPYYADGDHDGISDYDEFMIHHTNFNAADSDNDGVTDGDEILVNFTNPLSTIDADGDGIPDDFEKHFAKLLLAYEPKATHWGAYHTGLLAGNLDATHDYTGDGMNVRELAEILNTIPAAGPANSGYTVESEIRRNSLQSAYYYPLQPSSSFQGTYSYSVPNNYDVYESVTLTADLSSQYLLSRIDGVAWSHPWMRSGDQIYVDSVSTESAFRRTPVFSPNGTKFQGRMGQQRCRIIASNPGHKGSIRNYLKLINESNYFTWNNRGVISAEPFKVQFPKGRMVSDWYEFKSPFVDETGGRAAGMSLLPVDLDIIHPATGELADAKEDIDDGGYVSVQRLEDPADATSDVTPKTKVKIHPISGAQSTWKTRLKFNGADRYKIYRDEARTQEVISEQTEFDATQDTTLFFHGLKKSASRGGEEVTMQVKVNDTWVDGDSVKCTIVQSEFLIQVKGFIPYAWTEGEEITGPELANPMAGKVAKGDLHSLAGGNPRGGSPGFRNHYSTDRLPSGVVGDPTYDLYNNAPFRCCQTIVLTPYKELHSSYDLASLRRAMTAPSSDHYVKTTSVNAAEISLKKGYMDLAGVTSSTGKGPVKIKDYRQGARTGKVTELHVEYGGVDGALGTTLGYPNANLSPDIHWDMWLKVNSEADPLLPTIEFGGKHDRYPAYEIIVIQSDGTYKPIHNVLPAANALPGPVSLDDDNAMSIGRSDTIRD